MKYRYFDKEDTLSDLILKFARLKRDLSEVLTMDPDDYSKLQIRRTLYYLKQKEFIAYPARAKAGRVTLTTLGIRWLNQISFERLRIKQTPWDGKWRLVIFDIPEDKRDRRDAFRDYIKKLGLLQVQKSVWACPYPCTKEVAALCELYFLRPHVSLFEGKYIGDEKQLRQSFGL